MSVTYERILLGIDNCYVLCGESPRLVLIDAGMPGHGRDFVKGMKRLGHDVRDVALVVITHGHWDHIGSAKSIREVTGATLAMHRSERYRLERGITLMPKGVTPWGHAFGTLLTAVLPFARIPPVKVDLYVGDEGLALAPWGIAGRIVHTPGHSPGSLSVVLDSGEAFVGDLAMNGFPLRRRPGLPIFAEQPAEVRRTWRRLLDHHELTTIYPAHGEPFSATMMRDAIG